MIDPLTPFLVFFTPSPDMSPADIEGEIQRLYNLNRAIDNMLRGELLPDILFDMLAEQEIEPDDWVEDSLENCLFLPYG